MASAALFYDELEQVKTIGEFQHAFAQGLVTEADLRDSIGQVTAGTVLGGARTTRLPSTTAPVALQDLVVADLAVRLAEERGMGASVKY